MTLPPYTPPRIEVIEKEEYDIPFNAVALAAGQLGYSSDKISFPYKIIEIKMFFPTNAIYNVLVYWLTSSDDTVSAVAISGGTNPYLNLVPLPYFIGHAELVPLKLDYTPLETEPYIKMHLVNNNAYAITMMSTVRIRRL